MGVLHRERPDDDVDVESCLENLGRIDELVPTLVIDLRYQELRNPSLQTGHLDRARR